MTRIIKTLAALPLAAVLFTSSAYAGHPEKAETPAPPISAESLDDLDFSEKEIRIIRAQIASAQKRADRTQADEPAKSLKQQLEDIKLPTEAEIAHMQEQMPDINALMAGMMKLATDEDLKKGMMKSADRLKNKLDIDGFESEDGMPDFNAMMSAMISLMGDEEMLGGMIEAIEPIAELMDDTVADMEKKD